MPTLKNADASTKVLLTSDQRIGSSSEDGSSAFRTLSEELSSQSAEQLKIAREVEFMYGVVFQQLPERPIRDVDDGATEVNVLNIERVRFANTAPTTVTDFLDGQEGQEIVLLGDGQTTIDHGTQIKNSTGIDRLLSADKIYYYVRFNNVWIGA